MEPIARPTALRLRFARIDERTFLVEARGELDLVSAPGLLHALKRLTKIAPRTIVVDLSDTRFVDSTGLGVLVAATKLARHGGGELHIAGAAPAVSTALRTAGLHESVSLVPTVAVAVAR